MGQRSQIYIKVLNPVKLKRNYANDTDKKLARKMFGSGKHTILAIHHQWLYGRSVVYNIKHILNLTENMNEYTNPFSENYSFDSLEQYIKEVMMLLQVQTNPLHPRGTGIERMIFLNSESIDENGKYDSKWDIRLNFTYGDNNDGISIIDTIERKYCLMNISSYNPEYTDVNRLQSMLPYSADDYVECYYPNSEHVRDNILCCNQLKRFPILNLKEIQKMFPKMELNNILTT
jgi:hypothetical protein